MSSDNSFPSLPPIHSQGDPNSDTSQSPWNASSSAGSAHESLTLAPLDYDSDSVYLENLPFEFLPRLPDLNPPESSNSRHQAQQPPPPNQQHSLLHADAPRYQFSESPDLFDDFIEPDIDWQQDPVGPQTTSRSTRASSFVDLTEISPPPGMPPAKKRKIHTSGEGRSVRPRPQTPARGSKDTPAGQSNIDAIDVVDLIDIEDDDQYQDFKAKQQAQAIKQQQQDDANKPIKLAEFQCIICMDNPTDLTVTHCGHLFCSECLHQALYVGNAKKCCPVCRQVINTNLVGKDGQKKQPKNGFFALEMKLMTAKKTGKQAIRVG